MRVGRGPQNWTYSMHGAGCKLTGKKDVSREFGKITHSGQISAHAHELKTSPVVFVRYSDRVCGQCAASGVPI